MNKKMLVCVLCLVALLSVSAVYAADTYDIKVETVSEFNEEFPTYYAKIETPAISGLAEGMAYREINDEFAADADEMKQTYEETVEGIKDLPDDQKPHFGYEFTYSVVTDSDDYFVLKTTQFYNAGSSNTIDKYYNFDKHQGILVGMSDLIDTAKLPDITDYIKSQMEDLNEKGGIFWIDDVEGVMANVQDARHFYINADGDFVVCFGKYEVAPGAGGQSEFIIPDDIAGRK